MATTTQITATSTVTATASSSVNKVKIIYVPASGSYTSTNGTNTVFTEYNSYDFYGGDLYRGECQAGVPSEVDTSAGEFEYCVGFDSCLDVCSAYNFANNKQATPDLPCVGITYDYSSGFCYLKVCSFTRIHCVATNKLSVCGPWQWCAELSADAEREHGVCHCWSSLYFLTMVMPETIVACVSTGWRRCGWSVSARSGNIIFRQYVFGKNLVFYQELP